MNLAIVTIRMKPLPLQYMCVDAKINTYDEIYKRNDKIILWIEEKTNDVMEI